MYDTPQGESMILRIYIIKTGLSQFLNKIEKSGNPHGYWIFDSGAGGIRTLVPRRANAFRVRPVMTASIRLPADFSTHLILMENAFFGKTCFD